MAKFWKASEDIENMVLEVATELGLTQKGIDFEALEVAKAKEAVSVSRASAVAEYFSNREDLVLVMCYGEVMDLVEDKDKKMLIRMALDKISMDDKGKIVMECPQVVIPVGCLEKYRDDAVNAALLAQYTIAQIADKKREERESKKKKKKD